MMIKNVKLVELNTKIDFLEYTGFKDDLIEYKMLGCNKNYLKKFDENLKKHDFLIHTNFLTMISTVT